MARKTPETDYIKALSLHVQGLGPMPEPPPPELTMAQRAARGLAPFTVYRFWDRNGVLLYVGYSSSVFRRLRCHADANRVWHEVATITLEHFSSREEALCAEEEAIARERPLYNRHKAFDYDTDTDPL